MKSNLLLIILAFLISYSSSSQFIYRDGKELKLNDEQIMLRGMSFGNLVWVDREIPSVHHNESDFKRLSALGMNAIRFYLNYKTFEDDDNPYVYKETGWDWIDQNVEWAEKNGVYLILNMHVPQGGFQSQCEGQALWNDKENQNRLAALWKAIAERYKDETIVAAYDIVNEPTPQDSVEQWFNLAEQIVDSIRTVDNNHLLITERAIAVGCDYGYNDGNYNYPPLEEENIMYTVHMYDPYEYTHQLFDWANQGDGGAYPDESIVTFPSDLKHEKGHYNNPSIPEGNSDWTKYNGTPFLVNSDDLIVGGLVLKGEFLNEGVAYFDDVTLNEVDKDGNVVKQILKVNFTKNENPWFWSQNNDGSISPANEGNGDDFSYKVTGTTSYSTAGMDKYRFPVEKGKRYAVDGYMKGVDIPKGASATITTEYYISESGQKPKVRNADYLEEKILAYSKYIEDNGYPVYFGEFGVGRPAFENDKGGERWVEDVLKIFDEKGYHFTYHVYREPSFGLYTTWDGALDTTTVNVKLQTVFEDYFSGKLTSVNEVNKKATEMYIYPNPSTGELNLPANVYSISIYNVSGESVGTYLVNEEINLDFEKGVYLVRMFNGQGGLLGESKIVLE